MLCAGTLVAGWALKGQCLGTWDGLQYRRLCYNDIQPLYTARGIDRHKFPYIDGRLTDGELQDGAIEYPIATGMFMWASGYLATTSNTYLVVSALLLTPVALVTSVLLARMSGWRALLWAGAPALALYAFHNWDLLAVAATVGALFAAQRDRPLWAGALLGVGGALKLFPMLFLAPVALDRFRRDPRGAYVAVGGAVAVFAAANLPFAVVNPQGWVATYRFHALRGPDFNSIWHWVWPTIAPETLNALVGGLTAASCAVALAHGARRARGTASYPYLPVCAAMLASFLLWGKVHSPQYALWILPFFVVLELPLMWWAAYSAADLVLYTGIFRWFYDSAYLGLDDTWAKGALITGVWVRAALLAALFFVFLKARAAIGPPQGARRGFRHGGE
ncbi:MAG: DUF2029 domain-containing protein [Actinobacteria bacterium]|nr:DUF2029 domain-containing protein [Actinomycetota bacterium]